MARPAKGKKFVKVVKNPKTGRTRKISYGQAGRARDGGPRIRPGTKKGDSYCARSLGIQKRMKNKGPNTPNALGRKKWKCRGKKSMK